MPVDNAIEVKNLSFFYNSNLVLEDISFEAKSGDYVGIIGPNGGGKTTLLKILVGLLSVPPGVVKIFGKDINKFKNRSAIGYVPQRVAQGDASFPATVFEVVESGRVAKRGLWGKLDADDRAATLRAMEVARVTDLQDRLMSSLSGGQRQRVYVARALAGDPKILILDEPFVGVDVGSQAEFYAFLKDLNQKFGLTILFVSHDVDVIVNEVKSIVCLNRGLMCAGSPKLVHEANVIENLYGRKVTHLHHS